MKTNFKRIKEIAEQVIKNEFDNTNENTIRTEMIAIIGNYKQKIILEALGIEERWGEIRVQQSGSFYEIMKVLQKKTLETLAKQIYDELYADFKFQLSEKDKIHLRKVFKDSYKNTLEDVIMDLADEQARLDAPKLFKEYLESEE